MVPDDRRIPHFRSIDRAIISEDGPAMEACRQLAVRLRDQLARREAKIVVVVSALRDEGKTTVMANLAHALATLSAERSIAILDLDLRMPSVAEVLDLRPRVGIENVLRGEASLDDVCITIERPPLDVYCTAEHQSQAHELIGLRSFGDTMEELRSIYDIVLVDTPPTLVVPDVSLMLRHVDALVPVARRGVSRARSIRQMVEMLPRHKVVGEVLNGGKMSQYTAYSYGSGAPVAGDSR